MKRFLKILHGIIVALIILGFTLAIYIVYCVIDSSKRQETPSVFGYQIYTVATDSMENTIMVGDLVINKKGNIEDAKVNDIITFLCIDKSQPIYGSMVTHRVISIIPASESSSGKLEIITKGDHNPTADEIPVTAENYEGLIVHISSSAGKFFSNLTGNMMPVVFILIFILIMGMLSSDVFSIIKTKKEIDKEKENERIKEELKKEILQEYLDSTKQMNEEVERK